MATQDKMFGIFHWIKIHSTREEPVTEDAEFEVIEPAKPRREYLKYLGFSSKQEGSDFPHVENEGEKHAPLKCLTTDIPK